MHWLFLRGLAREQRHWGSFPETFSRLVPNAQVHCLDLPGAGTERDRASPTTVAAIAEDVRARWIALRDANVGGSWAILGMSLGGMVAMEWCARHPEDFARAVIAGSSAGDLSRPWRRFGFGILPKALTSLSAREPARREAAILSMTSRRRELHASVAATWAELEPMARANVLRQLFAASMYTAPDRLLVPALVIVGAADPLVDPSCSRLLAAQLGAPLAVHPDAGHELSIDAPEWVAREVTAWLSRPPSEGPVRVEAPAEAGGSPCVIAPERGGPRGEEALLAWIGEHRASLEERLTKSGALLLRGFDVDGAAGFERVARAFEPVLQNRYLGTSPRNALTDYVFSASELPPHYPIPQHCEMSFIARPPRRLFFSCLVPSTGAGGETPLADFRRVVLDLPADVRARFEARGVRNIRNYAGPAGGAALDPWKLKRWDEMFGTTDRADVARACAENGFELTWRDDGGLRLVNTQPAFKAHPVTGEPVWFNHAQVFHLSAVPAEYRRIAARQGQLRHAALARIAAATVRWKRRLADEDQAMQCTFGDGAPIPDADMDAVRDAVWKNMSFFKWRKGDVLVIDNFAMAHGRMPYAGPRSVAVAWA